MSVVLPSFCNPWPHTLCHGRAIDIAKELSTDKLASPQRNRVNSNESEQCTKETDLLRDVFGPKHNETCNSSRTPRDSCIVCISSDNSNSLDPDFVVLQSPLPTFLVRLHGNCIDWSIEIFMFTYRSTKTQFRIIRLS